MGRDDVENDTTAVERGDDVDEDGGVEVSARVDEKDDEGQVGYNAGGSGPPCTLSVAVHT